MVTDHYKIYPEETIETIIKAWKAGVISRELAISKLLQFPSMTFEKLSEIFKEPK